MNTLGAASSGVRSVRAVLFDLDGTLLDTAADISVALNRALAEQGLPELAPAVVRVLIGGGVPALIGRTVARLGAGAPAVDAEALLDRFTFHYGWINRHEEMQTRAYPGVAEGLAQLHALGLKLAVVTNKPRQATIELLTRLGLARPIRAVVGGDSVAHRKPHAEGLLRACEELRVGPREALMVGDSLSDVLAARAAGLSVICVPYGYNEGADPRSLPCDAFVESVADLPPLLIASGIVALA
ncbi:MAG: phosphoglycolate phosphatase [Gammaproteobacteria bacterium]|nr:MAG: phosphoglycolate phosphatase [Gammaproteobacteria bacterium]